MGITQLLGRAAEDRVGNMLERQGLRVLERNYRTKRGEIDLIGKERDGTLVFVEVRMRRNDASGHAAETVTLKKQHRIRLAAKQYLLRFKVTPRCRMDVVAIDGENMQWIRSAF